ncbi:MAG: O-antigen ligase family protein [Bdellovibrionaceae bacterium]|nr:O-antigen ligase family protein [Bdellovibrio sp.]
MIKIKAQLFKPSALLNFLVLGIIFFIPLAWSRYLNANYVSAKFFLFFLVSSLSLLVSFRKLIIPQLSKILWVLIIGLFTLHLAAPLVSQNLTDYIYLFKFFGFCFFTYYFYTRQLTDLDAIFSRVTYIILIVVGLILTFGLLDFYKFRIEELNVQSGYLLGSFGNVNMMTEFLALTLPLLFRWVQFKDLVPKVIKYIFFVLWVFLIMYCRSRSSWIGLFLWALWQMYKGQNRKEILLALAIAASGYWVALNVSVGEKISFDVKSESFKQRMELYKSTGQLIADNPLGVGVSHFDSFLVPYQVSSKEVPPNEYLHYDQPHSEILRWTAQLGWLGSAFAIAFILIVARLLLLKSWIDQAAPTKKNYLTESFLVLMPQVVFQFPYFNPASSMYLAFVFAMFLGLFAVRSERELSWKWRAPIAAVACVGIIHAFLFVTSILFESIASEEYEKVAFACDYYPINQNACFLKTYHLLKTQNFKAARTEFTESFNNFKFHRGLMRLVPTYVKYTSGDVDSCASVQVYKSIFPEQKFFDAGVISACNGVKSPVAINTPDRFKSDYQSWLNKSFSK